MKLFIIITVLIYGVFGRPQDPAAAPAEPAPAPAPTAAPATQQPGQLNPFGSLGLSALSGGTQYGNLLGQAFGNVGTGLGQAGGIAGGSVLGLGSGIVDKIVPKTLFGMLTP